MKRKWKTKDGTKIWIKDMTNSHIINTLRFLRKYAYIRWRVTMNYYLSCVPPTAEMAELAFDQEFDSILESDWYDFVPEEYEALLKQAEVRGLPNLEQYYGTTK